MKELTVKFSDLGKRIPSDIRLVMLSLSISSLAMCILLYCIGSLSRGENAEALSAVRSGFEPYIEKSEMTLSVSEEYIECSASDDINADLLARAIHKICGSESYAVRVAFGAVIMNRVESEMFPYSVSAVLRNAGIYPDSPDEQTDERSRHAALAAIMGVDPTMGALYIMDTNDPLYTEYERRTNAIYGNYAFLH